MITAAPILQGPPPAWWRHASSAALAMLGLFVPFSTAGTSVALALLALLCLVQPRLVLAQRPWREPLFALGLVLLAYIALRTVAAQGWQPRTLLLANRYHELLMIPLLWALMRVTGRPNAFLGGLLAGAVALAIAYWLPLPPSYRLALDGRRISAGFVMAACAFVAFEWARAGRLPRRPAYAAAALLALTVLFGSGRTGHVAILVLAACALWVSAPRRWRWAGLATLIVAVAVLSTFNAARIRTAHDVNESNKIRLALLATSVEVVRENWLLGTGWAAYPQAFQAAAMRRGHSGSEAWARTENPHNEYLLQLGAGGLAALVLFVGWLALPAAALLREGRSASLETRALACVSVAFALGCLFNSLLMDYTEGHFYGALVAWLMAQQRPH